jgi:hypothetical protein
MAVLSKTGITTGATIQVGHVTQSVDAFTGAVQYDITVSGSLVLTGSFNQSGSLRVSNAITASSFTGSFIGNHIGSATLTGSYTGSFMGEGNISGSFTGSFTGSLSGSSTTSTYVVSSNQNYRPNPGAGFIGPGNLGIIAGSITMASGLTPAINPTAIIGKVFQTEYWVTATKASGSTSPSAGTLFVEALPTNSGVVIKEVGAASNDDVNFIIVYLQ